MPRSTQEEKELRRQAIDTARQERFSKKMIARYYPNGIQEFDRTEFDRIFAREDEIDLERHEKIQLMDVARKNKNNAAREKLQTELRQLQKEKQELHRREKRRVTSTPDLPARSSRGWMPKSCSFSRRTTHTTTKSVPAMRSPRQRRRPIVSPEWRKKRVQRRSEKRGP